MNDAKFHAERLTGFGGSDAAAALGISKWKSQLDLYLEKRQEAPPIEQTEPMRWGNILEPVVLTEFKRRGFQIAIGLGEMVRAKLPYNFMLAHLDASVPGKAVVQAKTARSEQGWGEDGSSEAPAEYVVQTHHEMIVADLQLAYIPVLIAGSDFRVIQLPFDQELGYMIIEAERDLWGKIQAGTPPEPRTLADVNALYRFSRADAIEATQEIAVSCDFLRETRAEIAELEKDAEYSVTKIRKFMGEHDTLTYQGKPLCTWKSQTTTRLDVKTIKEKAPEIYDTYAVQSFYRRFLLKGEK